MLLFGALLISGMILLPACAPTMNVVYYQGTADVGDFVTIDVNHQDGTIAYENLTNGDSGTVSFVVNTDGTYTITTPDSTTLMAFEIEGLALVMEIDDAGPDANQRSLITAVMKDDLDLAGIANRQISMMQFRPHDGGFEIITSSIDQNNIMSMYDYSPMLRYGYDVSATSTSDFSTAIETDGHLEWTHDGDVQPSIIFGTTGEFLAVDTTMGSIFGGNSPANSAFNSDWAGTYRIFQSEKEVTCPQDEIARPELNSGEIIINDNGSMTVYVNEHYVSATPFELLPLRANLPGAMAGLPAAPAYGWNGFFTIDSGDPLDEAYVGFIGNGLIFCHFHQINKSTAYEDKHYEYSYGIGFKEQQ